MDFFHSQLLVDKFVPPKFHRFHLDDIHLDKLTDKKWMYSCCGKASLYHCLKSLNISRKILIPVYICDSIMSVIQKMRLMPIFYDLNMEDLNASFEDIVYKFENNDNVEAVLVASMYGNPANLYRIQQFCREKNLKMIDDAAQSFGAKIGEQFVGTFGDAGFFSFSPGKPTAGHLGSFFWTSNEKYFVKYKNHFFFHLIAYLDFYFNRYKVYSYKKFRVFNVFYYLDIFFKTKLDWYDDKMNCFEDKILGGILHDNFSQTYRAEILRIISNSLRDNNMIRVITKGDAGTNNHKLVVIAYSKKIAVEIFAYFKELRIFVSYGYTPLDTKSNTSNAMTLNGKILEIPIEDNKDKFNVILNALVYLTSKK